MLAVSVMAQNQSQRADGGAAGMSKKQKACECGDCYSCLVARVVALEKRLTTVERLVPRPIGCNRPYDLGRGITPPPRTSR